MVRLLILLCIYSAVFYLFYFTFFSGNISRKCIRRDKILQALWKFSFSLYYFVSRFFVGFPYLILLYVANKGNDLNGFLIYWTRHSRWFDFDISVGQTKWLNIRNVTVKLVTTCNQHKSCEFNKLDVCEIFCDIIRAFESACCLGGGD